MSEDFKELEITCPICQVVKKINVPSRIFSQKKFGTIKVQVPAGAVCKDHQFIVFVDPKGIIRGYEKIDIFMASTPEVKEVIPEAKITLRAVLNDFGTYGVLSLIHAKLFNYPSYLIRSEDKVNNVSGLNDFFDNLLPEALQGSAPLNIFENIQYDKVKIKEKNALLIDEHNNILQTPWDHSSLGFEEELIKKALGIIDNEEQLIILRQGINQFLKEVDYVIKTLEDVEEIYMNDLIEKMSKDLRMTKINKYQIDLIKEYIENRISSKLVKKIKNKVHEFLGLL